MSPFKLYKRVIDTVSLLIQVKTLKKCPRTSQMVSKLLNRVIEVKHTVIKGRFDCKLGGCHMYEKEIKDRLRYNAG